MRPRPSNPSLSPRQAEKLDDIIELGHWCARYQKYGPLPADVGRRFLIAQYQISQARAWQGTVSTAYQSYAAAALHFIMVAEALDVPWESEASAVRLAALGRQTHLGDSALLGLLCSLSQQVIYGAHSYKSNRKSRFDRKKTACLIARLVEGLFAYIPASYRSQACYDEMKIMLGDIGK